VFFFRQVVFRGLKLRDPAAYRRIARQCRSLMRQTANPELLVQLQQWAVECDRRADRGFIGDQRDGRLEQARRYHRRAEEYRAASEQLREPRARASYLSVAATYDAMARQLEALADRGEAHREEAG
jgi:uncharacterized protein YdbL (DUF1318 family)